MLSVKLLRVLASDSQYRMDSHLTTFSSSHGVAVGDTTNFTNRYLHLWLGAVFKAVKAYAERVSVASAETPIPPFVML